MKRRLLVSLVIAGLITPAASLPAACRVHRVRNVQHRHVETKIVVPFAVPVAVPVAVVSPYLYGYSQFASEGRAASTDSRSHAPVRERDSLVTQHCATCHSGEAPAGSLSLDRVEKLSLADRLAAIRAVLSRRMPKGGKLDDNQLRDIVEELSNYE